MATDKKAKIKQAKVAVASSDSKSEEKKKGMTMAMLKKKAITYEKKENGIQIIEK